MSMPMAAAGAVSPASSMLSIATEARAVSGEYRKTTADTVVMAFTNRYMETSNIAGRHTGTVTLKKVR